MKDFNFHYPNMTVPPYHTSKLDEISDNGVETWREKNARECEIQRLEDKASHLRSVGKNPDQYELIDGEYYYRHDNDEYDD